MHDATSIYCDHDISLTLENLAGRQPAAPAIHAPGRITLTYADLGAQIRYLRVRLGSWGVARGDIIAGVIPSRPEMAVALSTIASTATFAPLSPALTPDNYAELLTRLRPKFIIVPSGVDHPIRAAARRCGVAELDLTADPGAPAGMFTLDLIRPAASLARAASAHPDWAYVLNTSGTAGRSKLVPRSHRPLLLQAQTLGDWCRLTTRDVGCHLLPMHHGHGLNAALLVPLLRGESVVCLPESDIDGFFAALDEYGVTWLTATFAVHREILRRTPDFRETVARNRLRFMRFVSGRLEPHEIDRIERTFGAPVFESYGMTEACSITHDPLPPRVRKRGSAGVPLSNQVAVMSDAGALCAAGQAGEIVVRGPLVFDGYFDDPQATAAAFVDGWFRTGDFGRFDEEGYLYIAGRLKDLINRGGEKISPVEIDTAIKSTPGVREAATFGIPHPTLGEEVVAAVVKQDGDATVCESGILDQVRARMGPTRVPRRIYFVDELPLTESGKVRRAELPRLLGLERLAVSNRETRDETTGAIMSPLEAALSGLWMTVLQVKCAGPNDNFFLLGGDSLRGARLLTSVKAVFGVELPIKLLFESAATIAGMTRAIEAARAGAPTVDQYPDSIRGARVPTPIPRRPNRGPVHLSDTQRRMWFLTQLDPHSVAYNQSRAHRLTGAIDVDALARALRWVVARHEILRSTYAFVDDEPRQIVHDEGTIDFQAFDLAGTPVASKQETLQRLLLAEMQRPFDLAAGPLVRLRLVKIDERESVLVRVMHHVACDGWSSGIFERELGIAYSAFASGRAPELPALPIQYADYAVWQRERRQVEALDGQLAYWKEKLAGLSTLELPTDRPRPPVPSNLGAHLAFDLPAPLTQALRELGRREGATLFMTLLAAFQVLLHRFSGQEDIAVGTPIAGRRRTELAGLIGFFANTLVLRSDLAGNPPFTELLARVRESALGAYTHQDIPFEKLVEELSPRRDMSRNPLFQVMFNFQNAPDATLVLDGLESSRLPLPTHSAKFDLTLAVRETAEGLQANWRYSTDLFDAATVERMTRHFTLLLEGIGADADQRIGQLPLLTAAGRHQLLVEWNDTAADYPADRCIHELFEAQVERSPDRIAVVTAESQLTYRQVNAAANRIAARLRSRGVGSGRFVPILMEVSAEFLIAELAVMKSGAAFVPFDPAWPQRRIGDLLEKLGSRIVLIRHSAAADLAGAHHEALIVGAGSDEEDAANPRVDVSPDDPIYCIFTSGSTGLPKGAINRHRGIVNRLSVMTERFGAAAADSVLTTSPAFFDAAVWQFFWPLTGGGRSVIFPTYQVSDPVLIPGFIERHGITCTFFVPSVFHLLVEHLRAHPEAWPAFGRLRRIMMGGEAMTADPVYKFKGMFPHIAIANGYGPTETSIGAILHEVPAEYATPVPIGRPISNVRAVILDRHLNLVPVGIAGELCLGGACVGLGYLNDPESTARAFIANPFAELDCSTLYRTGDLARFRADGNIECLGRIDHQVKIRGIRIEPGEIEAALGEHPAVREAVVLAREDTPGNKRLVAYIVPADASFGDSEPLRAFLRERLPDYMQPSAYVVIERLPLSPTGKVDRRALPPPHTATYARHAFAAPVGAIERTLAQVWAEMLKLERVGRDDNFFELGGHSLLGVQVLARMRERTGIELPLRMLFESPTPAALAARIAIEKRRTDSAAAAGSGHFVNRQTTGMAARAALAWIDRILGKQLDFVRTWKGHRSNPGSFIVTLNVSGKRQGLFWCLQGYRELTHLAAYLGTDRPVHGMRSGHLIMEYTGEKVGALASYYAAEMSALQPAGPCLLGGNCQGARIAHAIALRLRELGRTVSLLFLMEHGSFAPYEGAVALLFGRDSDCNPYQPGADPEAVFRSAYSAGFTVDIIAGAHGEYFESPQVETLASALKRRLPDSSQAVGADRKLTV